MSRILRLSSALALLVLLVFTSGACGDDDGALVDGLFTGAEWTVVEGLSPLPEVPPDPSNAVADIPAAATLGQRLFFETSHAGPIVTGADATNGGLGAVGETGKIACASCHMPAGWLDDTRSVPEATSLGAGWNTRNTPTAVNAVFYRWYKWAGGSDTMWHQAIGTTESSVSHNSSRLAVAHMLFDKYRAEYEALFGAMPDMTDLARFPAAGKPKKNAGDADGPWETMTAGDQDLVNGMMAGYGKLLAAYERLLVSRDAPFDLYVAGDTAAIGTSAKRGLKLFVGKAGCVECHKTPLFSDSSFHNLGLPQLGEHVATSDSGRFAAVTKLLVSTFNSDGDYSDGSTGLLAGLAVDESQRGQFRTKHLRQIAETGPYMHTGQFSTLRDVIDFYNSGGDISGATVGFEGVRDELIVPLNLGAAEIDDLIAFLETLTGRPVPAALLEDTSAP